MEQKTHNIVGFCISDVGKVRKNNEDNFLLGHCLNEKGENYRESHFYGKIGEWTCAGIFDGMGGREGGEIASYLAAQVFQEKTMDLFGEDQEEITRRMENAFEASDLAIMSKREERETGGTTATVMMTDGNHFRIFHKGDSRAYLLREQNLYMISKDQTLAQLKLDVGIYRSKEEVNEKENHQLMEYIGMGEEGMHSKPFETDWIPLKKEDKILMCSDGITDMCTDTELLDELIQEQDVELSVRKILQRALMHGGKDNATLLLIHVT